MNLHVVISAELGGSRRGNRGLLPQISLLRRKIQFFRIHMAHIQSERQIIIFAAV